MSLHLYGPWHAWFAWHPVPTGAHGWKWLRRVQRRRWTTNPTYPGPIYTGWDYTITKGQDA